MRATAAFPTRYDAALALRNRRYTAAAVLSIAYGSAGPCWMEIGARPARLGALRGDLRAPVLWRKLEATRRIAFAQERPGDWTRP